MKKTKIIISVILAALLTAASLITISAFAADENQISDERNETIVTVNEKSYTIGITDYNDLIADGWTVELDPEETGNELDPITTSRVCTLGDYQCLFTFFAAQGQKWNESYIYDICVETGMTAEIEINGKSVVLGQTTLQELLDDGWTTEIELKTTDDAEFYDGFNAIFSCGNSEVDFTFSAIDVQSYADAVVTAAA